MRTAIASLMICVLSAAAPAQHFVAYVDGKHEVPPNGSAATGVASLTLNADHTLTYSVSSNGLTATIAHIHSGPVGVSGPILFPLAGGPTSWSGTTPPLTPGQQDLLLTKGLYVNIHTAAFPAGEIRGQIVAITVAHGLRHAPLGAAVLSLDPAGNLRVANIGSSGQDGVAIDLGEAHGKLAYDLSFPGLTLDTNPGSHWRLTSLGQVGGVPNELIGSVIVQRELNKYSMDVDFSPIGATVLTATAFRGKALLIDTTFTPSSDPTVFAEMEPSGCVSYSCPSDKVLLTEIEVEDPVLTVPVLSAKLKPDTVGVEVTTASASPQFVSRIHVLGHGVETGSFTLTHETLAVSGLQPHVALGQAVMQGVPGGLLISNIGSSGQDGVSIELGKAKSCTATWKSLVPSPQGNLSLKLSAQGSVGGQSGTELGSLTIAPTSLAYALVADYSAIGSATQEVQVYDDGVLVADVPGHSGAIVLTGLPGKGGGGGGGFGNNPDNVCFVICTNPDNVCFTIGGSTYDGDELRVIAEGGASVDFTSSVKVCFGGVEDVEIQSETVMPLPTPWSNLGCYLGGEDGFPNVFGNGPLLGGSLNSLELVNTPPGALSYLFVSFASFPVPFKGGTLKAIPIALSLPLLTDPGGGLLLPFVWPVGLPSGLSLYFQYGIADPTAINHVSLSNALRADVP